MRWLWKTSLFLLLTTPIHAQLIAPVLGPELPHIDAINLHEEETATGLVVWQEIVFHAPDGNVTGWQNELIDVSTPAPAVNLLPGVRINMSKAQQVKGAIANTPWHCGEARSKYSFVKRITLVDAAGRLSNSVDATINCH